MKEYKLIPLNEVDTYVNVSPLKNTVESQNVDSKPSPLKNVDKSQNPGGDKFKDRIVNLLMDKDADDHFKIILLNYMSQKMVNKTNENISENYQKKKINLTLTQMCLTLLNTTYFHHKCLTHIGYLHILLIKIMLNGMIKVILI